MSNKYKFRILELAKQNNITLSELATKCQVSQRAVYYWANYQENDSKSINSDDLRTIAKTFGITMEDMYTNPQPQIAQS